MIYQSVASSLLFSQTSQTTSTYFGLRAIDQDTGGGIPLVRFKTTSNIALWSDSQGYAAFNEPGLMNTEVYFEADSPGYEAVADGFGFRGVRVTPQAGKIAEVRLKRNNLAERIGRVTGQGIFRDSELLGIAVPRNSNSLQAGVTGSDSVQMVPYRGRLFWLWGDTNFANYPLGNFHVTAATSPLPRSDSFPNVNDIALEYFTDSSTGRAKKMLPTTTPGAVWLFGMVNLKEGEAETLVGHYSRHLRLGEMVEHGIATFDDATQQFQIQATFELSNKWQIPSGQAFRHQDSDGDFVYFADPFPVTRVPARLEAFCDPQQYQAFAWDSSTQAYHWQSTEPPIRQADEKIRVASRKMPSTSARFQVIDRDTSRPVMIHRASINWNDYRHCWIMIGCESNPSGVPSHLGEIWYAEAPELTGPWTSATKIATHPGYSFYNPRHHTVWDQADGRYIYFEGTYTQTFSGNQAATPRYEYNQLLYRLDLATIAAGKTDDR
ncbi:MAG: hypothetical protein JNL67_14360 [Planctomycetaceae bacterium]|nr:hypothetical protein [Planctomycetaceae bacterium]